MIPVVLYLIFQKRIRDKVLRVIVVILTVGFFTEAITTYLSIRSKESYSITNVFILLETIGLLYFFYSILVEKAAKILVVLFSVFFFVLWLKAFISYGTTELMVLMNALEATAFIILSLYYFFEQIKIPENNFIYTHRFLIVVAYLIYNAGTFFVFSYFNNLNIIEKTKYMGINSICVIIKTVLLCIVMCIKDKNNEPKKFQLT